MKTPFLKSSGTVSILLFFLPLLLQAQVIGTVPSPVESIEQNSVSNMEAFGDTLWIGPGLNRNIGNENSWLRPAGADSVTNGRGRVFSLSLAQDTVFAGLGYTFTGPDGSVQTGIGYHMSTDGGSSWVFEPLPLDAESDTSFVYGDTTYSMLPITVPQQSPPFDVDFSQQTVFTANWASGILRSTDFGNQWERLILPPQSTDSLVPEQIYDFASTENTNRYDPRADQNLLGFAVLIDHQNNVWAGTAGGLNISDNAMNAPQDSVRWRHLQVGDGNLLSNWIITLEQQPATHDIWMTNWPSGANNSNEQYGLVRTSDQGETFDQYHIGQRINDVGFWGNHVFAAGTNGVFISPDNGNSWTQIQQIQGNNSFIKSGARYFSVAVTSNRVWIGTSDGLASTADLGQTWQITRVNFPLTGSNHYQSDAPNTNTYAYPNPFSPSRHDIIRIKFEVKQQGNVKIRLFDFGMNLIREIENDSFGPGTYEAQWDGRDGDGNIVANGPVFYQIETADNVARGKILVFD